MEKKTEILHYVNDHQDFFLDTFIQLYRDDIVVSIQNNLNKQAGEGLEELGLGITKQISIDPELDITLFFEQWGIAFEPAVRVNGKDVQFDVFITMDYSFKIKGVENKFHDKNQKYNLMLTVFDGQIPLDNLVKDIKESKDRLKFYNWNNNNFDLLIIIKGEENFPVIYGDVSLMLMRSDNSTYFRKSKELMPG